MGAAGNVWRRVRRTCNLRFMCAFFSIQTVFGLAFIHLYSRNSLPELVESLQRASPLVDLKLPQLSSLNIGSKVDSDSNRYKDGGEEKYVASGVSGELRKLGEKTQNENEPNGAQRHENGSSRPEVENNSRERTMGASFLIEKKSMIFSNNQTFSLKDDYREYFVSIHPELTCYTEGTDLQKTNSSAGAKSCVCKPLYHGPDCGLPDAIWHSQYGEANNHGSLKRRKVPRRVINGMPLLNEVDLLEARINDLAGAVDLFLLAESNYSAHGDPKKLHIKEKLENGFLKEFHHQILHVFVDFFPEEGKRDSWFADRYLRIYMGKLGIPRISGVRGDDLFVINDADEIPSREVIMFLKLYDGYSEPISLSYRWSIYGFFFKNLAPSTAVTRLLSMRKELTTTVSAVATMGLVSQALENDPFMIRNKFKHTKAKLLGAYTRQHPGQFGSWTAGRVGHYCGWHCSWCFDPDGIVLKLDSAQAGDRPRWGDYPEKHEHTYLEGLIRDGRWFDGSTNTMLVPPNEAFYAPPYMLEHASRFQSILFHPAQKKSFPNSASYVDVLLSRNETNAVD